MGGPDENSSAKLVRAGLSQSCLRHICGPGCWQVQTSSIHLDIPAALKRCVLITVMSNRVGALLAAAVALLVHATAFHAPRTPTQRCSLRASVDARDTSGETPLIKSDEDGDAAAVRAFWNAVPTQTPRATPRGPHCMALRRLAASTAYARYSTPARGPTRGRRAA